MRNRKTAAIYFSLLLAALISGCTAKETPHSAATRNVPPRPASAEKSLTLTAEPFPSGGIRLAFGAIPRAATSVFVNLIHAESAAEGSAAMAVSTYAHIRDTALDTLKKSGELVCPFVKAGIPYSAGVYVETNDPENPSKWLPAECIPASGIYPRGKIELLLDEARSAVTLSAEPALSEQAPFASGKYHYTVTVKTADNWGVDIAGSETAENTSWLFAPFLTEKIKTHEILESGTYRVFVTAWCALVHGEVTWSLELAKSAEFDFTF